MTRKYTDALRGALRGPGVQKLMEATEAIQAALSKAGLTGAAQGPGPARPAARKTAEDPSQRAAESLRPEPGGFRPNRGQEAPRERASGGRAKRPLADVVDLLRKGRPGGPAAKGKATRPPPVPEGARFLSRSFEAAAGARAYKLYVPASLRAAPKGMVVMLHGCSQDPDDFAVGTGMNRLAEEHQLLVLYPAQSRAANPSSCWNWFDPKDQERGRGEPSIIAGMTDVVASEFGVPRSRVYAAGLSAGGAMALILANTYPEVFSAVGVHSGLPYRSANDVPSAFKVMRGEAAGQSPRRRAGTALPRTIIFHGDGDQTVHLSNAEQILEQTRNAVRGTSETRAAGSAGGRSYTRRVIRDTSGTAVLEFWSIAGGGHAWSGGDPAGSYAEAAGPHASREMIDFFLAQRPDAS